MVLSDVAISDTPISLGFMRPPPVKYSSRLVCRRKGSSPFSQRRGTLSSALVIPFPDRVR